MASNPPVNVDALGLIVLDVPASGWKCALVKTIMTGSALMPQEGTLFHLWASGMGAEAGFVFLDMEEWFDLGGGARSQLWQRAQNHFRPGILYYADNLPCNGESNWLLGGMMDYTHDVFRSHVRMINLYRMYLKSVRFKVAKHCTAGCCDHLRVKFKGRFEASDTVDFNPGQFFNIPGTGHRIADSLIIACYDAEDGHNDFVIHSESDEETTAYMECP